MNISAPILCREAKCASVFNHVIYHGPQSPKVSLSNRATRSYSTLLYPNASKASHACSGTPSAHCFVAALEVQSTLFSFLLSRLSLKMDFNGSSPYPEGVISFLDTDLYKLTMQCAVLQYFPKVQVTYAFKNRTPDKKLSRAAFKWLDVQINSE